MSIRLPSLLIALSLVTLALVPAASAASDDDRPADIELATTQGDEIPVCVTKPSPDPKGEEEICVAVIDVPDLPDACVTTPSPDPKGEEEICVAAVHATTDVTVDTTKLSHCVGPWTTETTVDLGAVSVTLITCDPFMGQPPW